MAAGQTLDLKAEFTQPLMRELDLSVFKGIFVAAAHEERQLIAIGLEEVTKVEPVALRFVISHEARCCGEVEQAIVTVQGALEFADLGIRYPVAL